MGVERVFEVKPMIVPFGEDATQLQRVAASRELEFCNQVIGAYGLSLSTQDIRALVAGRVEALQTADRVEFGGGVVKDLVLAFCSSSFVTQHSFVETVLELQELFYEFKNESLEQIPDEDLIKTMRSLFDDVANGDLERLGDALFDGLGRHVREQGVEASDAADPGADDAVMNGYTLAAHRYDVSKWVDDTYAPPWEGASWLDE
jgi:hypothetical protein